MKKIFTALFAISAFAFTASAQDKTMETEKKLNKQRNGQHKNHGAKMEAMEKLNLSEAQRQQMKSINEDFKNKMQELNKNDNIMVKDMKVQRKALMQERKDKVNAILTPEQKTKMQ